MMLLIRRLLRSRPFLGILLAFASAFAVVASTGSSPTEALWTMLYGAIGDVPSAARESLASHRIVVPGELLRSLAKATPLLLSGLAVAVALRAGLFNIGAEGQILLGAFAAAAVGAGWHGAPMGVHLPLCLLAGMAAGAAWAAIAGVLKAWRGSHEVIVTIMLNYVAIQITHYLVNGPARDPGSLAPATRMVEPTARLWALEGGTNFSAGIAIALLCAVAVWLLFAKTRLGFELRAVGENARAASSAGVRVPRTLVIAMALSGALAGLAGAVEVLGVHRRYLDAFSPGYGFDSIAVAFLGNLSPGGIIASACMFGGIAAGAVQMEAYTNTPRQIAGVIQAIVILVVAAKASRARLPVVTEDRP